MLIAYFVAEPLIIFLRFSLLPFCLERFGERDTGDEDEESSVKTADSKENNEAMMLSVSGK